MWAMSELVKKIKENRKWILATELVNPTKLELPKSLDLKHFSELIELSILKSDSIDKKVVHFWYWTNKITNYLLNFDIKWTSNWSPFFAKILLVW